MKAIVVTDQAAGTAGMKLGWRIEKDTLRSRAHITDSVRVGLGGRPCQIAGSVLAHGGLGVGVLHVPETAIGTSVHRVAMSRSYPADWLLARRGKAAVGH